MYADIADFNDLLNNPVTAELIRKLIKLQEDTMRKIRLSIAIDEFLSSRKLVLSPYTIRDYSLTLRRFREFFKDDPLLSEIGTKPIREFLFTIPGGRKNVKNAHIALAAMWTYLIDEGYCREHIVRKIKLAKPEFREVIPFQFEEVRSLLNTARDSGRDRLRNVAILKVMLDTGIRAAELCNLTMKDIEGTNLRVFGKGAKERRLPLSPSPMSALEDYHKERGDLGRNDPVFLSEIDRALTRFGLGQLIDRLGKRCNIIGAHPHKFRHTFAINYLLNGGDPYTLQAILGHSTLDMVKRYLHIVEKDIKKMHDLASPVKNWDM